MKTNASEGKSNNPDAALRQKIEERAYHIWLESGCAPGDHERHWLQAESELTKVTTKGKKAARAD